MNHYAIGGLIMNPKFVTCKEFKLVGYELKTSSIGGVNYQEIPAFWQACLVDGRMKKLHALDLIKNHAEYGACSSVDPETGEFSYFIGLELTEDVELPKDFGVWTLPSATYAVFSTPPVKSVDFSKTLKGAWQFIMNEWFPNSGYEYAPNCIDFEHYDYEKMPTDGNVCDIYVPVIKVEKNEKIDKGRLNK
jgi:AraC family transcriptional regulator